MLPDNWDSATYALSDTNSNSANFSSNTMTALQWITIEQGGVVFLPAAGYRYGTSVSDVGSLGDYWSASYYLSSNAYDVRFIDGGLGTDYCGIRCGGRSVRLVRVAEN